MKVSHKGNGVHQGLWVGTLTMSPADGYNEEDMINAMRKIFAQQTVPLKKWAYYREYTKNGTPHIHFFYETETGGRIHKKIFQRYWKLWDEPRNQTGRGGFPGGYHTSAKSETAYLEYMSKDGGRNAFKGFKLEKRDSSNRPIVIFIKIVTLRNIKMPPKRTRKTKPRRKVARKKTTVNVNRALQPIPQRFIVKQKYSQTFPINNSGFSSYGFNLNSVYDPDRSSTGHQPYGYDQLSALYNRYRVINCSWRINVASDSVVRAVAMATNDFTSFAGVSDMVERPRARYIVQQPGAPSQVLTGTVSIPSLVGRSKAQYMADDRYQAETNANPQELALLWVAAQNMSDASINGITCTIILEYTVEYFDLKTLTGS